MTKRLIKQTKQCVYCGEDFIAGNQDANFCSRNCAQNYRRNGHKEKQYIRKCVYCGKEFDIFRQNQVYCSLDCNQKHYRECNGDYLKEHKTEYYEKNKESILLKQHENYLKNPESTKTRVKRWAKDNPEKRKANTRKTERKRRAIKLQVHENYTKKDELFTMVLFGHKCFNCGDVNHLCIDHIYPLSKGNPLTRENACVLCIKCNCSKSDKLPEDFYTTEKLMVLFNTIYKFIES